MPDEGTPMKIHSSFPGAIGSLSFWARTSFGLLLALACLRGGAQPWTRPSLTLWLKADVGVATDGSGAVTQWDDQSTRGNHLTQTDAGRRPLRVPAGLNALPIVQFRDDWLIRSAVLGTDLLSRTSATVFIVQKQLGSDPRTTTLAWRSGGEQRLYFHASYDDTLYFQVGNP